MSRALCLSILALALSFGGSARAGVWYRPVYYVQPTNCPPVVTYTMPATTYVAPTVIMTPAPTHWRPAYFAPRSFYRPSFGWRWYR